MRFASISCAIGTHDPSIGSRRIEEQVEGFLTGAKLESAKVGEVCSILVYAGTVCWLWHGGLDDVEAILSFGQRPAQWCPYVLAPDWSVDKVSAG
jgi:hypothetical protein